jgi:MFS family permease
MKPVVVVMFLFATPGNALWLLPLALFVDSIWNSGHFVANNGYMMKVSPQRNRSVFIASITGFSGICGGLGAIAGGAFMRAASDVHLEWMGREWCNYHLIFAISAVLRFCCTFLAYRIREPESSGHDEVLSEIQRLWPMRYLLFPVGFYRLKVLPALIDAADRVRTNLTDDDSSESGTV